jgi:hypothetical protein
MKVAETDLLSRQGCVRVGRRPQAGTRFARNDHRAL